MYILMVEFKTANVPVQNKNNWMQMYYLVEIMVNIVILMTISHLVFEQMYC